MQGLPSEREIQRCDNRHTQKCQRVGLVEKLECDIFDFLFINDDKMLLFDIRNPPLCHLSCASFGPSNVKKSLL